LDSVVSLNSSSSLVKQPPHEAFPLRRFETAEDSPIEWLASISHPGWDEVQINIERFAKFPRHRLDMDWVNIEKEVNRRPIRLVREETEILGMCFVCHPNGVRMIAMMWRNISDLARLKPSSLATSENVKRDPFSIGTNRGHDSEWASEHFQFCTFLCSHRSGSSLATGGIHFTEIKEIEGE
jgi:hypothetical protein